VHERARAGRVSPGADVAFGSEWRSREDLNEIARKPAERAQLPTAPTHG